MVDLHETFSVGLQWENRHELNSITTQHHLPQVVMTYQDLSHPIKTNTYKPSYLYHILINLHKIFSIGPQWANRHELNINFTSPKWS